MPSGTDLGTAGGLLALLLVLVAGGWAVLFRVRPRPTPPPAPARTPEHERQRAERNAARVIADKEALRTRARVDAALHPPAPADDAPPTPGLADLVNDRRRRHGDGA